MKLAPGDKFGRYTIDVTLGIGGMGHVFRATDHILERTVALKIIRADKADGEAAVARFFREAKLAAQLSHPNTVQIFDLGEVDGTPFIAMEYIDGRTLAQLASEREYDTMRRLRWMASAARGLAAAHKRGMVHRDVKPANIMVVTIDDVVKVVDFGLAKRTATTAEVRRTFQTELGYVVGTPVYMAPEQLAGSPPDARCDQFSWGVTAYALLAGQSPRRLDPSLLGPIKPLAEAAPEVPEGAAAVIMRALELDPEHRYDSMDTVARELDAALVAPAPRIVLTTGNVRIRVSVVPAFVSPDETPVQISLAPVPDEARALPFVALKHPLAPLLFHQVMGVEQPLEAHGAAPRAADPSSENAQWRFERRIDACPNVPLQLASFSPNGKRILAFARGAIVEHAGGAWRAYRSSSWLSEQIVACVALLDDGSAIIGGAMALAAHIMPDGSHEQWKPEQRQPEVSFCGVEVMPEGWVTFVGSRGDTGGAIAWPHRNSLQLLDAPTPLSSVVTLRRQRCQLACGPKGAVAVLRFGMLNCRSCAVADLVAIAPGVDGAHIVGAGGHAVFATDALQSEIEKVATTSTLTAVTTTAMGTVWAASARGRILRRHPDSQWLRASPDFGVEPHIIALWASEDRVRAVAKDGSLILGWRVGAPK